MSAPKTSCPECYQLDRVFTLTPTIVVVQGANGVNNAQPLARCRCTRCNLEFAVLEQPVTSEDEP